MSTLSGNPDTVELHRSLYWVSLGIFAGLLVIAIGFAVASGLGYDLLGGITVLGLHIWNSWLLVIFLGVLAMAGIRIPTRDVYSHISVLNVPAMEGISGPVFFLPLVMQLVTSPVSFYQEEFPGPPEKIAKPSDFPTLPAGMVRPMFITTGGTSTAQPGADPLSARMTLEPTITVMWQIEGKGQKRNQGFWEFYVNIEGKDLDAKLAFINKILRDTAEGSLRREMSKYTPSEIYTAEVQRTMREAVKADLCEATRHWGIDVVEVNILGTQPDHATNLALGQVPRALADAAATAITAEATKTRLTMEGQGRAAALAAEAAATGKGMAEAAEALNMSPADYAAMTLAAKVISEKAVIFGADGIAEAVGALGKVVGRKS